MAERYDYIICGAGCAGLSLAYYLSLSDLGDRKVLLLDKNAKSQNDRTWCFWEKGDSPYEEIVDISWDKLYFYSTTLHKKLDISPYKYKKIRGIDFYNFVKNRLSLHPNITWRQENISEVSQLEDQVIVTTDRKEYNAEQAFVSYPEEISFKGHHHVLQHFKGWEIETEGSSFTKDVATFMDFRTGQSGETRFLYVLPKTDKRALVELAIFSDKILEHSDYDKVLKDYIDGPLQISEYHILEEEFGVIPMTTYPFEKRNQTNIKYIGTAGGWVKATSGYAFERIQRLSKTLAKAIEQKENIDQVLLTVNNRYRSYDKIFLNVILTGKKSGEDVFTALFKSLPPQLVFKFLDEETSFVEDLRLFTGPPTIPFIKGFLSELLS